MERRKIDFANLDGLAAEVERLQKTGCTKVGNWNLAQTCEHLHKSMRASLDGFGVKAPWLLRVFLAPIFKRRIFKTRSMPVGIKGPPELMPGAVVDDKAALQSFHEQLTRVRNHQGAFQKHPFFGTLAPEEWRQFHIIHGTHHLNFLIPNENKSP